MHISPISEERENIPIKNEYIPHFKGYSQYFTDIAHAYFDYVITMASACACFHQQWPKLLIQIVSNWEFRVQIGKWW